MPTRQAGRGDSEQRRADGSEALREGDAISGDNLERTVTLGGESDLSSVKGKRVRLRFYRRRARLYSLKFT